MLGSAATVLRLLMTYMAALPSSLRQAPVSAVRDPVRVPVLLLHAFDSGASAGLLGAQLASGRLMMVRHP